MESDLIFQTEAADALLGGTEDGTQIAAVDAGPAPLRDALPIPLDAAQVVIPDGQTVVRLAVTPGEVVVLPFGAEAPFLAAIGNGNLAIKVGDTLVILEGYVAAAGETPPVIESADGKPLDIAAILAATDPAVEIETAAGPGGQGGQGTDNTGAIFQQLGQGEGGLGGFAGVGGQGDSQSPDGRPGVEQTGTPFRNTTTTDANVAPVALDVAAATDEDHAISGQLAATDADGDPLIYSVVGTAPKGLTLNPDGSWSFDPTGNHDTLDTGDTTAVAFQFKANDGKADSNTATFTIDISGVNDAPRVTFGTTAVFFGEDDAAAQRLLSFGIIDPDDSAFTITQVGTLPTGIAYNPATQVLTGDPAGHYDSLKAGESAKFTLSFEVSDGEASTTRNIALFIEGRNDAPVAVADAIELDAGGTTATLVGGATSVLANDSDVEGDSLTATVVSGPLHGTLTLNADGTFSYTHDGSANLTDSFTYTAHDGTTNGNTATVNITAKPVNLAPVAVGDSIVLAEGGTATVLSTGATSVLANDTDKEGNALSAVLVTGPANGTLTLNADGTFNYTHNGGETLTDSFTYKAHDGNSSGNTVTVNITVNPVNDLPVATDDAYLTTENRALTVPLASGILSNDTDAEGSALSAVLVTGPAHGTLTLAGDGTFTYTPSTNFNGTDSFTYRANDGTANGNAATVIITVDGKNDAPIALPDTIRLNEGGTATLAGGAASLLANDFDFEGDPLSAVLVSNPAHGTLTLNADGTFIYTHDGSETLDDIFTYKANDGTVDGVATVVVITVNPVNDLPVATDDAYLTTENRALTVPLTSGILTNDTDAEGGPLSAVLVNGPAHGALTLAADGTFTYTPSTNFNGTDSFTYRANDGTANGNTATVTITVDGKNDAPIALPDTIRLNEGGTATLAGGAASLLANDFDFEGDPLSAVLVSNPAHGTLTLNADGTFIYTHDGSETLDDIFTYKANDGTVDGAPTVVVITVNPVNDAPAIGGMGGALDYTEGEAAKVIDGAVTVTDTDSLNFNGGRLTVSFSANGTAADQLAILGQGTGPGQIGISNADVTFGGTKIGTWSGGTNGSALVIDFTSNLATPAAAQALIQAIGYSNTSTQPSTLDRTVTFVLRDGDGTANGGADTGIATATIHVAEINTVPTIGGATTGSVAEDGNGVTFGFLSINDPDPGESGFRNAVAPTAHGLYSLASDGSWIYLLSSSDAAVNALGDGDTLTDSFTAVSADGTASQVVTVTINGHNDAPQISLASTGFTVDEEGSATTLSLAGQVNISDPDSKAFTYAIAGTPPPGVSLDPDGTLHIDPAGHYDSVPAGQLQDIGLKITVSDGTASSNVLDVPVKVAGVNDVPTIGGAIAGSVAEDGSGVIFDFLTINDPDSGESGFRNAVAPTAHGLYSLGSDGSWVYLLSSSDAAVNALGDGDTLTDSFTAISADGTASQVVTVTINGHNDAPVAAADTVVTNSGSNSFAVPAWALLANDTDPDSASLTVRDVAVVGASLIGVTGPIAGEVAVFANPGGGEFTYKANDGSVSGAAATVTVVNQLGGPLNGAAAHEILVGSRSGDRIDGHGGSDLIFGDLGDDSVIFHNGDIVQGGADTVLPSGGLGAVGGRGDVLAIDHDVNFTGLDLSRFGGIETLSLRDAESGGSGAQALTIGASDVQGLSDHTITPGGVFAEHAAIRIDADLVDQLYLSISKDGGSWSDTGVALAGYQVYAHDSGAGADAYVMVATANTGNVHLNQDA
ncbi:beta strand repeat-containing protein [Dongia sedimenti]|uniref:Ig-like domain-containing protein n=1 Tax=Dongia sedimenti TaxID=3064282 RepID=A0ABU0YQV5_9PROT|nr:Ig-like domain-containing protein [Rhodospirillaceae bacterium R-7]